MTIDGIGEVEIRNVRGIASQALDLGADTRIVVLSGANGTGKTSTCTALSLLLNGPAFERGARPAHVGADGSVGEPSVRANVLRGTERATRVVKLDIKGTSCVIEESGGSLQISEAEARLPRRASVFLQDHLEVDLDPLVEVLLGDLPAMGELRTHLAWAASRLDADVRREFPSKSQEDGAALEQERRAALGRFLDLWEADPQLASVARARDRLALRNNNAPVGWPKRVQSFIADVVSSTNEPVGISASSPLSDAVARLAQWLDDRAPREVRAPSRQVEAVAVHLPQAWIRDGVKLACIGEGALQDEDGDIWPLPVDEGGLAHVRALVTGCETQVSADESRLRDVDAARAWTRRGESALEEVLRALRDERKWWASVPEVEGVDGADLREALVAVLPPPGNSDRALMALRSWTAAVDASRLAVRSRIQATETRLGRLRDLLVLGTSVMSRLARRPELQNLLAPGRHVSAETLSDHLYAPSVSHPVSSSSMSTDPASNSRNRIAAAAAAWQQIEVRREAHAAAEASDRGRKAAMRIVDAAVAALAKLSPKRGPGPLELAAGVPPDAEDLLVASLKDIARHHFRTTGIYWGLSSDKTRRSLSPVARLGPSKDAVSINLDGASTGERTIAGLSLTVALHLLLRDRLNHRVLIFDDFTTAFDLAQLPAVALLLRKLAWNSPEPRKLVISSHHEEITNRLLEMLAPPPGESLRVLQFQAAHAGSSESQVETYEARGEAPQGAPDTAEAIFARIVTDGLAYLAEEPETVPSEPPRSSGAAPDPADRRAT